MARHYLIDKDAAKLKTMLAAGKTVDEVKAALFAGGNGVTAKAVDDYVAASPDLLKKKPAPEPEGEDAPEADPEAPKGKKAKKQ